MRITSNVYSNNIIIFQTFMSKYPIRRMIILNNGNLYFFLILFMCLLYKDEDVIFAVIEKFRAEV